VIRAIVENGYKFSAVDAYRAIWRLQAIRKQLLNTVFDHLDLILLPTTGTQYKIADIQAHPISLNANLGYYTNFVNLLDLCGLAVPNGFTSAGLPMGVTFISRPFADDFLLNLGAKYERSLRLQFGKTGHSYSAQETPDKLTEAVLHGSFKYQTLGHDTAAAVAGAGAAVAATRIKNTEVALRALTTSLEGRCSTPQKVDKLIFRKLDGQWHPMHVLHKHYLIQLDGSIEIESSDGSKLLLQPGDVLRVDNVKGKSFKSRAHNCDEAATAVITFH